MLQSRDGDRRSREEDHAREDAHGGDECGDHQGKARPPQELNPKLPPGLAELITKAMAVDKTKRFQSMDEMRIALERFA